MLICFKKKVFIVFCICRSYTLNVLKIVYDDLVAFIFIYYNFKIMLAQRTILYILKHHVFAAELNQLKKSYSARAPISFIFSLSARGVSESVRVKFHEY